MNIINEPVQKVVVPSVIAVLGRLLTALAGYAFILTGCQIHTWWGEAMRIVGAFLIYWAERMWRR